ncbi:MAG TPA: hypothetical protein VMW18_14730 [Candidatus Binatia bacterium]|nr:hypothetical protein [Candidatus Binatia bacterium]
MVRACFVVAAGFAAGLCSVAAGAGAGETALVLENRIPLLGVAGRIDHLAVDIAGRRLFVAELENNSVDVVNLDTGVAMTRIAGLKQPQGIAYLPDRKLLVVANAGDGSVRFFAGGNLAPHGSIDLGEDADNVRVDPESGRLLVGYGKSGAKSGLAVIDPARRSVIGRIALPGHPESFQIDDKTGRAYANVPDAQQIAVIDVGKRRAVAGWKTPGLADNFPMALGADGKPLAVVFRQPSRIALLDPAQGSVAASLDTCGDSDDVYFDGKRNRLYLSCGEGLVDVLQPGPQGLQRIDRVVSFGGARTSLFVPELDRLYVAARANSGADAAILVYRPGR